MKTTSGDYSSKMNGKTAQARDVGLPLPAVYAIANLEDLADPLPYIAQLLNARIELIQLRSKQLPEAEFSRLAADVILLRNQLNSNARILINDSVSICKAVSADGVHLGQGDQCPKTVRAALGAEKTIGLSTHSIEQIRRAPSEVLDYLALGPIFPSPTKQGHAEIVGTNTLTQACDASLLPVVAIGGITTKNASSVYRAGASSIATISELQNTNELEQTIKKFAQAKAAS